MKKLFAIAAFCLGLFAQDATIEIVNTQTALPRIVIEDSSALANTSLQNVFYKLVVADLKVTSSYEVVSGYNTAAYASNFINKDNAKFILRYQLSQNGNGVKVDYTLAVTDTNARVKGSFSQTSMQNFAFLAHLVVSDITKKLGLADVSWLNKKVVLARYVSPKVSEIVVADYTLTSAKTIIAEGFNHTPKWANRVQNAFYYTSVMEGKSTLYRYDLTNNKRAYITSSSGMLAVSDVSSNAEKILLSMGGLGQSEIYTYDATNGALRQISHYSGIDVGGVFAENESKIYFVSNRLGFASIFATQLNGGETSQVVTRGKNHFELSAAGDYAVYASRESKNVGDKESFNLYLISAKTDHIRQLTPNGYNVNPRLSADANTLLYLKRVGLQSAIGLIKIRENKGFSFASNLKITSFDW